jgi:hypothetical protein
MTAGVNDSVFVINQQNTLYFDKLAQLFMGVDK